MDIFFVDVDTPWTLPDFVFEPEPPEEPEEQVYTYIPPKDPYAICEPDLGPAKVTDDTPRERRGPGFGPISLSIEEPERAAQDDPDRATKPLKTYDSFAFVEIAYEAKSDSANDEDAWSEKA